MKKIILILALLVMLFALVACNGTTSASNIENSAGSSSENAEMERQFSMPTELKLMLGTVKLDETEYAIDATQASKLLPLWKALRSLGESDTTAQAEIDSLINQIEDTMTAEQINAIDTMQLTSQDTGVIAEILGIELGGFGGRMGDDITPEMQATFEAARESGDFPGGGPGSGQGLGGGRGPGGGFEGAEMDPDARATAIAERGDARGTGFGINTVLLDGIIQFLESK